MVFVVNTSLKMGAGKMAAQVLLGIKEMLPTTNPGWARCGSTLSALPAKSRGLFHYNLLFD